MCEGIAGELLGMDFGDERLNRRSVNVLAADPQASVNGACAGWVRELLSERRLVRLGGLPDLSSLGTAGRARVPILLARRERDRSMHDDFFVESGRDDAHRVCQRQENEASHLPT